VRTWRQLSTERRQLDFGRFLLAAACATMLAAGGCTLHVHLYEPHYEGKAPAVVPGVERETDEPETRLEDDCGVDRVGDRRDPEGAGTDPR